MININNFLDKTIEDKIDKMLSKLALDEALRFRDEDSSWHQGIDSKLNYIKELLDIAIK